MDNNLSTQVNRHNDVVLITLDIIGISVGFILVDTGSSVNILYLDIFKKLNISQDKLQLIKTPLSGFIGDSVKAEVL